MSVRLGIRVKALDHSLEVASSRGKLWLNLTSTECSEKYRDWAKVAPAAKFNGRLGAEKQVDQRWLEHISVPSGMWLESGVA